MKKVERFLILGLMVMATTLFGWSSQRIHPEKDPIDLSKIYGKIQIVDHFPDYKVKIVDHFPDLRVQIVEHFPDSPGKWKLVDHFPDYKIQWVEHFEDFKIKKVDHFPGVVKK